MHLLWFELLKVNGHDVTESKGHQWSQSGGNHTRKSLPSSPSQVNLSAVLNRVAQKDTGVVSARSTISVMRFDNVTNEAKTCSNMLITPARGAA
jgi:hypothetical protein